MFLAILFEILGTTFLKQADQFTRLTPSILCILCYLVAFYMLSVVLKTVPVGIAYAIWSGIGIIGISLIGLFFFKQSLDIAAYIGIGCIIAGVIIINVFSQSAGH